MKAANFTPRTPMLSSIERSRMREREPVGRERLGRERSCAEPIFGVTRQDVRVLLTPVQKRPKILQREKSLADFAEVKSNNIVVAKQPNRGGSVAVNRARDTLARSVRARYLSGD